MTKEPLPNITEVLIGATGDWYTVAKATFVLTLDDDGTATEFKFMVPDGRWIHGPSRSLTAVRLDVEPA